MSTPAGRRVVVTGLGAVTPLGSDVPTYWRRLVAGESGIGPITTFDASGLPSQVAGEALDFDPTVALDRKEVRRNDRTTQMAIVSAREAMADAGLPPHLEGEDGEMTGVLMSSGLGGTATLIEQISAWRTEGPRSVSPFFIPMAIANMPSGIVSIAAGALGPNYSTTSACASAGHAMGESFEIIRRGDADMMLAGGCEAPVAAATVAGFARMRALSTRNEEPEAASRPFDADRDGFVVAEGSGTLVLEELEHAERRGARIYAEVLGYGATADGYHMTTPAPGGAGAVRAARRALAKSGLEPEAIDLISAHATSTGEGDPVELQSMHALLGEHAAAVSVTATKSSIGHTLGAAGAVAAVAVVMALQDGVVPPTLNLHRPDEHAGVLDLTPLQARRRSLDVALINAFGFGGQNSAIVVQRWAGR
jgi:3-oxoacyl-[acyl-carrier-protein] synthase II